MGGCIVTGALRAAAKVEGSIGLLHCTQRLENPGFEAPQPHRFTVMVLLRCCNVFYEDRPIALWEMSGASSSSMMPLKFVKNDLAPSPVEIGHKQPGIPEAAAERRPLPGAQNWAHLPPNGIVDRTDLPAMPVVSAPHGHSSELGNPVNRNPAETHRNPTRKPASELSGGSAFTRCPTPMAGPSTGFAARIRRPGGGDLRRKSYNAKQIDTDHSNRPATMPIFSSEPA